MEFVTLSAKGHTRPAVIAVKPHAMAIYRVLFARKPAKSAVIIRNAASHVMNPAHHVPRIVPGLVHIGDDVPYHVQCPAICYHAQSAVQIYWLVGIDARPFVGRPAQMLRIVRFVRTQQSRE